MYLSALQFTLGPGPRKFAEPHATIITLNHNNNHCPLQLKGKLYMFQSCKFTHETLPRFHLIAFRPVYNATALISPDNQCVYLPMHATNVGYEVAVNKQPGQSNGLRG